ncbi:hypothetical protein A2533_01105 [Candidatus Falkowbacteria bacterium RIFOXYD2_FULL_35_9]|uniref:AB hydrolase-1 domain-containing protein n=1 Tax=Candidatus Falkowbacteria bacterium RIFOXYC2_FULL_36_12 TaxID=1798002 RepID=A0A1F5SW99_9BACT|nr:MAG: hypothetical protein A2300_02155 [Candidatus Falkowbacteria bacterium RIFOXYB2_FULL_35_7]OGF31008.1 MAG: hypothetical protein A2478_01030 [Candidatus Falkowbacteria bacterium RIFOXYC2_FULL_36_12]OGF34436.1 MAG: hypothetical protein A2223_02830 [Candidatus Falkowbacteria bacterium RIFOXYA2_FULL_35_8]OGF47850.1 MAG: hypothetical protein A2533_01105 [Candidatus Falkowbacteria bacterium RIFOXYD2_FULL_35_9]
MQIIEFKNFRGDLLRGVVTKHSGSKGIIFVHGFERNCYEYKFRNIFQGIKDKYSTFRFDFSGCGLSEGKFEDFTVEKSTLEFDSALEAFKRVCPQLKEIVVVGHSIAGCMVVNSLQEKNKFISKVVLFAPAWNQEEILKYYFVRGMYKDKKTITWDNYKRFFSPLKYKLFIKQKKYERKAHWLKNDYFIENIEMDYQDLLSTVTIPLNHILVVQSLVDSKVPIVSNNKVPKEIKQIILRKADHDFEAPSDVKQYLGKVMKFISG